MSFTTTLTVTNLDRLSSVTEEVTAGSVGSLSSHPTELTFRTSAGTHRIGDRITVTIEPEGDPDGPPPGVPAGAAWRTVTINPDGSTTTEGISPPKMAPPTAADYVPLNANGEAHFDIPVHVASDPERSAQILETSRRWWNR